MKKLAPLFSILMVLLMLVLATISQKQESAIMDEVAHIPAGYSYLTQKDMRLNPEHPPLLKDLSAIPLLFIKGINFPSQLKSWTSEINSQWNFGFNFLYNSNNDADKIIFWARIPMLLLLILLGFFIYKWTKKLYGKLPALLAVFLFSFSPTFLAHGRYVTTDVGAAFAFFFASYFFIKFLKNPRGKNLFWAGISFGIAQMIKFSLFLLVPFFGIITLIWIYIQWRENKKFCARFIIARIDREPSRDHVGAFSFISSTTVNVDTEPPFTRPRALSCPGPFPVLPGRPGRPHSQEQTTSALRAGGRFREGDVRFPS